MINAKISNSRANQDFMDYGPSHNNAHKDVSVAGCQMLEIENILIMAYFTCIFWEIPYLAS